MAYFAQLDGNNVVTNVIVVNDDNCLNQDSDHCEQAGIAFCKNLFGNDTKWVETKADRSIRYHHAGIGYSFDEENDAFVPPQPYPSWTLNKSAFFWQAPTPYPEDGNTYYWDETTTSWVLLGDSGE